MSEGVSPWTTYKITLKGFSTISSNASGVVAVSIPADPSSAGYNFSEWSNLSGLFDEVRILKFEIQLVALDYLVMSAASTPLLVGFNSVSSAAPGSEGAVAQLIWSSYWQALQDRSSSGKRYHITYDSRLDFGPTSSVVVTPFAGCPGSFQMYGSAYNNSVAQFKCLVTGLYEFRSRS